MDDDLKDVLAAGRHSVKFVLDLFEQGSDDVWPEARLETRVTVADDGTILATDWPATWKRARVRKQSRKEIERLFDELVGQLSETNEGYGWYSSTDGKGHDLICYLYTPLAPLPKVEFGGVKYRYFAELQIQLD